jgi:hypothetical protein
MAVPAPAVAAPARPTFLSRVKPAHLVLAAIVIVSAVARLIASYPRAMPRYLPDEFLYAELARSIGRGDGVSVLGQPTAFPALLEPLLTAPLWTAATTETSIHLTQAYHSIAMALAAVPVYLIARRLDVSTRLALACAAAAVVTPGLLYASYMTADAVGYLLALVAVLAAVRALDRPSVATQAWFLLAAGLATFARLQYAVLVPAFMGAALVVERWHVVRAVRRFAVVSSAVAVACVPGAVLGSRLLGRYEAVTGFGISQSTGSWAASTAAMLAVVAGAALVPGAVAWMLTTVVRRDADRKRAAFAALTGFVLIGLVAASAVMSADTTSNRFFERYLICILPLVVIAFCCWADDGRPGRFVVIGIGAVIIVAAARFPVSGQLIGQGSADSPTLLAVSRLGGILGLAEASLVAALVVSACAVLAMVAAMGNRVRVSALIGVTIVLLMALSAGAHVADLRAADRAYRATWNDTASWIEAERPAGDVLLVHTPGSNPWLSELTALWNPSIRRAAPLGHRDIIQFDGLGQNALEIADDGTLTDAAGRPVTETLVFATGGTVVLPAQPARIVRDRFFTLVVPDGPVRLAGLAEGVRAEGTLAPTGRLTAYPPVGAGCTRLTVRLTLPARFPPTLLAFQDSHGNTREVPVQSGATARVEIVSTQGAPQTLRYRTLEVRGHAPGLFDSTVANVRASTTTVPCASA